MSTRTIPVTLPDEARTLVRLPEHMAATAVRMGRELAVLPDNERAAFECLLRVAEMNAVREREMSHAWKVTLE
jgi:hypothetical protein